MAVKHTLEAASYSPLTAVKEAADLLLAMMRNYKRAYTAAMNEASALYTSLVQDFGKAGHAAAVGQIPGASEVVAQLDEDNAAFKDVYRERAQGEEFTKEEGTLRNARKATDSAFAGLVKGINAFHRVNEMQGDAKDPDVSDTLRAIIVDINAYLHQHQETYERRTPRYRASEEPSQEENQEGEENNEESPKVPKVPRVPDSVRKTPLHHEAPMNPGYRRSLASPETPDESACGIVRTGGKSPPALRPVDVRAARRHYVRPEGSAL
jgi:hypothetical protein